MLRWRPLRNFPLLVCHVIAINDENVILCARAYTAHLTDYPFSGQPPWPVGIDNEFGTVGVCLRAAIDCQGDRQGCAKPNLSEQAYFFFHFASHTETDSEPRSIFMAQHHLPALADTLI
jgi:hypothetical protein